MSRLLLISLFLSLQVASLKVTAQCATPNKDGSVTITTFPNTYYPGVTSNVAIGATTLTVGPAGAGTSDLTAGDLIVIMQMQGGDIAANNDDTYGDGVAGGFGNGVIANANYTAGTFEFATVSVGVTAALGGAITLAAPTTHFYENADYAIQGQRRYQVIRVPQNTNITLGANIQPPYWNGSTGGVLILEALGTFTWNGFSLDASGRGFRGGGGRKLNGGVPVSPGARGDYLQLAIYTSNAEKGEGTLGVPQYVSDPATGAVINTGVEGYKEGSMGRGAPGNAGGGATANPGNGENSGGGGGANAGAGGKGGNLAYNLSPFGGEPGAAFTVASPQRLVLGGGGGAGSTDNASGVPALGAASSGAPGGGIVIVRAKNFVGPGLINVNGANGNTSVLDDGSGGGGAGGSVLIVGAVGVFNISVNAAGGAGGSNTGLTGFPHGPGGGGAGGYVYSTSAIAISSVTGGIPGTTDAGSNFGATAGADGIANTAILVAALPTFYQACGATLPIKLTDFTGVVQSNTVLLKWATAQEATGDYIILEKSSNGRDWEAAAKFSASANSATVKNYQSVDGRPVSGKNYYKLKLVDRNGQVTYSSVVIVNYGAKGFGIILAPNPNPGKFGIYSDVPFAPSAYVKIVAGSGQIMAQRKIGNLQAITFDDLKLSRGVYTAVITDDEGVTTKKFVVQ